MTPRDGDLRTYARHVGTDPDDSNAVEQAWATGWAEMAGNLATRALHLIETTDGPVTRTDPLELLGITPPTED